MLYWNLPTRPSWNLSAYRGIKGDDAPNVKFQYSADGENWHNEFNQASDIYMRTSNDGGQTWSDGMEFIQDLSDYARQDGFYEQMTVGTAMNLAGSGDVDAEFASRSSGGSADIGTGAASVKKILGETYFWNQYAGTLSPNSVPTGVTLQINGNSCTITVSDKYDSSSANSVARCDNVPSSRIGCIIYIRMFKDSSYVGYRDGSMGEVFSNKIGTRTSSNNTSYIRLRKNIPPGTYHIALNIINLTDMFGSGHEPTSVREIEDFLANKIGYKDNYPYTTSVVRHNKALGIKSVGRNLYDPATGKAELPALTGTPDLTNGVNCFQIIGTYTGITDEDGNAITPNEDGYFTVAHPMTITVAGGNADDTCVALTWSGVRNGEYEPHREDTMYFVDADHDLSEVTSGGVQVFQEGLRAVYDVRDSIEGDKATVAIGKQIVTGNVGDTIYLEGCDPNATEYRCVRNIGTLSGGMITLTIDIASSGITVYYPLATPQVYTLDQHITMQYAVDDFGTEKRISKDETGINAPLLIRVQYAMNATDTIRRLPQNYISKGSMDNLCAELADKLGAHLGVTMTITAEYDEVDQEYDYAVNIEETPTPEPEP